MTMMMVMARMIAMMMVIAHEGAAHVFGIARDSDRNPFPSSDHSHSHPLTSTKYHLINLKPGHRTFLMTRGETIFKTLESNHIREAPKKAFFLEGGGQESYTFK